MSRIIAQTELEKAMFADETEVHTGKEGTGDHPNGG
jgi:hypothetical protein